MACKIENPVQTTSDGLSLEAINTRLDAFFQTCGDGPTGLIAQIRNLDFSSPERVEEVRGSLSAAKIAFDAYHSGLVKDMAFGEAFLSLMDLEGFQNKFQQIEQTLDKVGVSQLSNLADNLHSVLSKAMSSLTLSSDINIDQYKSNIKNGLTQVKSELDKLDPAKAVEVFQDFFETVSEPLKKFEEFKTEIEANVRDAFQAVHDAIQQVDLTPVQDRFLQTVGILDARLNELDAISKGVRKDIQDSLNQVKTTLESTSTFISNPDDGLKKKIEELFDLLFQLLDSLNIQQTVDEITQTLQPVSKELSNVDFSPVVDATVEAINGINEVLKTISPLLVTDDLKEKLRDATQFLKQVKFDKISDTLTGTFEDIIEAVDDEVLGKIDHEYKKVVASVGELDPTPMLQDLQKEVFDPLIVELEKVNPKELLSPLQEGYDEASNVLNEFNPTEVFSCITEFFDELTAKFAFVGSIGTDFPAAGYILTLGQRWVSQTMHKGSPRRAWVQANTTEFALNFIKVVQQATYLSPIQRDAMISYAIGHVSSIATSVILNPFINYFAWREGGLTPQTLAIELDAKIAQGFFQREDLNTGQSWEDYY